MKKYAIRVWHRKRRGIIGRLLDRLFNRGGPVFEGTLIHLSNNPHIKRPSAPCRKITRSVPYGWDYV